VHRIDLRGAAAFWSVEDEPSSLSVNPDHNLLVIYPAIRQIKEYNSVSRKNASDCAFSEPSVFNHLDLP